MGVWWDVGTEEKKGLARAQVGDDMHKHLHSLAGFPDFHSEATLVPPFDDTANSGLV
jgi:hypothetical protein